MFKRITWMLSILIISILTIAGCGVNQSTAGANSSSKSVHNSDGEKLNIVATTTMLTDLAKVISGDRANVKGLMGPGIDPHLYQASAGDVSLMAKADVIIYNGFHLEGKMGEIFESLTRQNKAVIALEKGLDKSKLLLAEENTEIYDPHIWFDVGLWQDAASYVAQELSHIDPDNKDIYQANLQAYLKELNDLQTYIQQRIEEIPPAQRILITAHDAFGYFGKAYGFQVEGLQGISTDTEAGTSDVSALADFILRHQVKAIFVESSISPKTIEALQAAVRAKGFEVAIGGELYSDSLGGQDSGAETYALTFKSNIDTIIDALKD
jgi:manganese/zinc/iron transport system substrate-binding protein